MCSQSETGWLLFRVSLESLMFGTYGREAKGELVVIVAILISMQCARI